MSTTYLRVKIKSLGAEARIIRLEEHRAKTRWVRMRERARGSDDPALSSDAERACTLFFGLQRHRKHDVRQAARSSQIAYGFIRGRPYTLIERSCYEPPHWQEVARLVRRFEEPPQLGDDMSLTLKRLVDWSLDQGENAKLPSG